MILQPVDGRLTPNNCAVILMDYQSRYAATVDSTNREILIHNAINLAKISRIFNIPTLLTTIGESNLGGPVFSELQEIFPDQIPMDRTTLSLFEDTRFATAMEKIGRNNLVIAGLWTDFGVAPTVEQARELGFEVFLVVDACGDVSMTAHQTAIRRLLQRGASPITWLQMLLAFHRDWAPPEAYEALRNIARDHATAYGLEIRYARPGLDEDDRNGNQEKAKERWWERWSMVTSRPLRKSQKRPC